MGGGGGSESIGREEMSPHPAPCQTSFLSTGEKERKEEPSAHVRGLWDSVVSWMKMAVDFVAQDSTAEAEPSSSSTTSQGKVSPLIELEISNRVLPTSLMHHVSGWVWPLHPLSPLPPKKSLFLTS